MSMSGAETRHAAESVAPPSLESVLSCPGSNAAFAIFVQEQANAASPAHGGDGHGHSVDDAPNADLHNNGIPGMRIGCGRAGCVDVEFFLQAHLFSRIGQEPAAPVAAAASVPSAASPAANRSAGVAAALLAAQAVVTQTERRRRQVEAARAVLDKYLLRPAMSTPLGQVSMERHRHLYPPLHVPVSADALRQLREQVEAAEAALNVANAPPPSSPSSSPSSSTAPSSALLLPSDLFQPLCAAVLAYLDAKLFPLFLSGLSCDHLVEESLLLGDDLTRNRLLRSAHNAYKEEYVLFYIAYEQIRREVEAGPPQGGPREDEHLVRNLDAMALASDGGADGGVEATGGAASSSSPVTTRRGWFDSLLRALEQLYRVFLRPNSEYPLYVEPDVRAQVLSTLKLSRKFGRIEYALLHALLAIKDYAVEVIKYDVMPQYRADCKAGHVRARRASLLSPAVAAQAKEDAPSLVPILKAPPPLPAQLNSVLAHAEVDGGGPPAGAGGKGEWDRVLSSMPRRASLVNAAVDVPMGARRSSIIGGKQPPPLRPGRQNSLSGHSSNDSADSIPPPPPPEDEPVTAVSAAAAPTPPAGSRGMGADPDEDDSASSFPAPPSNPQLRSMRELRSRRSITSNSLTLGEGGDVRTLAAATAAAATAASARPKPGTGVPFSIPAATDSDEDAEDGSSDSDERKSESESSGRLSSTVAPFYSEAASPAFMQFAQTAEALLRAPPSPSSPSSAAPGGQSGEFNLPAFTLLKRRSVVGSLSIPRPPPAGAAASSAGATVSAAGAYDPDRCIHFRQQPFSMAAFASGAPFALPPPGSPPPQEGGFVPDLSRRPKRSILKSKIRSETFQEALKRVFAERVHEASTHLPLLQAGCLILKYNAAGKAAERWFKVSPDGTELCWGKVDASGRALKSGLFNRKKKFPLADVTRLRYGASATARFAKYNLSPKSKPWMAWSVSFPDKVLDLVSLSEEGAARWFAGVQALAPLSTGYLSRAGLLWRRAAMKVRYYSLWQNISAQLFLDDLLAAARHDVADGVARLPASPVVHLLDTQIAAMPEEKNRK